MKNNERQLKVLVSGSFDPVTEGHLDLIKRAAERFGTVYAVIFINPDKKYMFSLEQRKLLLTHACEGLTNVVVGTSDGMVADFCREHEIRYIIRGYRNDADLEYERAMAAVNKSLYGRADTLLFECAPRLSSVSSCRIREALVRGDRTADGIPSPVKDELLSFFDATKGKD